MTAKQYGEDWMFDLLLEASPEDWRGVTYPMLSQILANANAPAFDPPADEGGEAVTAAWDALQAWLEDRSES